ncbi:MAG: phosphoribosylformimino-5-aminoimidazole carboxamide ribotide isomerase [Methanomethylovorans sp.]|nr:phosphoribosylformimino-5-aminoimidazole carboxamide ribotide isomerase [Methanomethylovorans sp.]
MFRIVFALDLYNMNVVHAQGGNRKNYRPVHLKSLICSTSEPIKLLEEVKPKEVYIADLNILQGKGHHETNFAMIEQISSRVSTMLDLGISSLKEAMDASTLADTIILGTETASLRTIKQTAALLPGKVNVSIDKKHGQVLTSDPLMPCEPADIIRELNLLDIKNIIMLDMDRVGTSSGVDSQFLSNIVSISNHDVLLGGGVKDIHDIETLERIGVKGALVATALHNGSIPLYMAQQ